MIERLKPLGNTENNPAAIETGGIEAVTNAHWASHGTIKTTRDTSIHCGR